MSKTEQISEPTPPKTYDGFYQITTHTLYVPFDKAPDSMMEELILADRACVCAENMARELMKNKSFYKGYVKNLVNKIYNPKGKSIVASDVNYMGASKAIATKMYRNLTDEQVDKLADMVDSYDDLINKKVTMLINSIMVDVKSASPLATLASKLLANLYVCLISLNAFEHLIGYQGNSFFALCKNPFDPFSREKAYILNCEDLRRIEKALHLLTIHVFKLGKMDAIGSDSTMAGIMSIIHVSLDYGILYSIAESVGIDLRLTSNKENWPETIEEERKKRIYEFIEKRSASTIKENRTTIKDVATAKGWIVKEAS